MSNDVQLQLIVRMVRLVIDFQLTQIWFILPKLMYIFLAFWLDANNNFLCQSLRSLCPTFEEIGASIFDFTDLQQLTNGCSGHFTMVKSEGKIG